MEDSFFKTFEWFVPFKLAICFRNQKSLFSLSRELMGDAEIEGDFEIERTGRSELLKTENNRKKISFQQSKLKRDLFFFCFDEVYA